MYSVCLLAIWPQCSDGFKFNLNLFQNFIMGNSNRQRWHIHIKPHTNSIINTKKDVKSHYGCNCVQKIKRIFIIAHFEELNSLYIVVRMSLQQLFYYLVYKNTKFMPTELARDGWRKEKEGNFEIFLFEFWFSSFGFCILSVCLAIYL
jgi:hypothetical protein